MEECENAYLDLSGQIFTPRRSTLNVIGQGKDFLKANGKFDERILERVIKSQIVKNICDSRRPESSGPPTQADIAAAEIEASRLLLKDPDPACKVYIISLLPRNFQISLALLIYVSF
jgi:hypothetical protein